MKAHNPFDVKIRGDYEFNIILKSLISDYFVTLRHHQPGALDPAGEEVVEG